MIYKKIQWFADTLGIYRGTVKNIMEYLNISSNEAAEYPISALPTLKQFYETHDCRIFFNQAHAKVNKQSALAQLHQNPDVVVLRDIIDYQDQIKHWRLVALLNNRSIAVYKQHGVAYISREDYERHIDAFNDVANGVVRAGSHPEQEVYDFIQSIYHGEIRRNVRDIISPLELDIYIPDIHLAVEFNDQYWHSELSGIPRDYHEDKSRRCEAKGIRLIHIYEWEWNDDVLRGKIEMILRSALGEVAMRIHARKCDIRKISNKEARAFNNANHLQSHRNARVTYGLFYNDELVQLMSFGKSRYNFNLKDENSWEIIRSCTRSDVTIVGGLSKLFKRFIQDNNPTTIFSYCDFNKFDGRGYTALKMQPVGYTGPNMWWLMPDSSVLPRSPSRNQELKSLSAGRIWGAGSKKYLWKRDMINEARE